MFDYIDFKNLVVITDPHFSSTVPASRIDDYPQTLMQKFDWVCKITKELKAALLIVGDIFNTPTQPDYIKNAIKEIIKKYGVLIYTVAGNHDLLFYNPDIIDRTSYAVLNSPGLFNHLNDFTGDYVQYGDWKIYGHSFGAKFLPKVDTPKSVILSHSYYVQSDKLSVSAKEVSESQARFICFGHDHNQYPVEENNGTLVVRQGAMSRGTSNSETRARQVSIAVLDLVNGTAVYEPIPLAKNFHEVFKEKYSVSQEKNVVSFDDIRDFIDKIRNMGVDVNVYELLDSMEVEDNIRGKVESYLENVGLVRHIETI